MIEYGHRIIEALFKRRAERTAICAELASRREADRDHRDIRVFEIGLSAEQYRDYEQGSGVAALEEEVKNECNALGIGPAGLGGNNTVLAVHIDTFATHIAGLLVAVNICCHVNRHSTVEL